VEDIIYYAGFAHLYICHLKSYSGDTSATSLVASRCSHTDNLHRLCS